MSRLPSTPAAVLFDMDGTLVDSEPHWQRAEAEVMERYGATWTHTDSTSCLGGPLSRVGDLMTAKIDPHRRVSSERIQEELMARMEELLRTSPLVWRPGADALLAEVRRRGIPTALVTASYRSLIDAVHDAIARDLGTDPFDVVIGGDEVGNGKPHPEPYLKAAAALGVAPATCLVIEDSPTGVAAGHAAGCQVIAVEHVAPIDPRERVCVVTTLEGVTLDDLWSNWSPSVVDGVRDA